MAPTCSYICPACILDMKVKANCTSCIQAYILSTHARMHTCTNSGRYHCTYNIPNIRQSDGASLLLRANAPSGYVRWLHFLTFASFTWHLLCRSLTTESTGEIRTHIIRSRSGFQQAFLCSYRWVLETSESCVDKMLLMPFPVAFQPKVLGETVDCPAW